MYAILWSLNPRGAQVAPSFGLGCPNLSILRYPLALLEKPYRDESHTQQSKVVFRQTIEGFIFNRKCLLERLLTPILNVGISMILWLWRCFVVWRFCSSIFTIDFTHFWDIFRLDNIQDFSNWKGEFFQFQRKCCLS